MLAEKDCMISDYFIFFATFNFNVDDHSVLLDFFSLLDC